MRARHMKINLKNFLFLVLFSVFLKLNVPQVQAQTVEQLHQSNPNFEKEKIHAQGIYPPPAGLYNTYKTPESLSKDGAHFDFLFNYVSLGTFICFAILMFIVFYFTIKYRDKPGAKAFYTDGHNEHKYTLIVDILFFIFLDLFLIYWSVVDTAKYMGEPPNGPEIVKVQVMPQQWVWNFRYAGKDGNFGTADDIVTTNELWIPKDKTVSLQIKSKDVIHGFMVHEVRRQMDALPGTITRLWFEPTRTGDFEIACMHLCGTAHYKMKAFMKVVEQNDFNNWSQEMSEWSEARYDPEDKATHWGWTWLL